MNRRAFISGTAALLGSPRRSWAQVPPRRIGYLRSSLYLPNFKVWQDSLRDHGWIEGKNVIVDYRSAEGHAERLAPLANELVALKPDVLVGPGLQEALALKSATASIPIVFVAVSYPERLGLVQSLSHPGGNVTGLAAIVPGNFLGKVMHILREMVPAASKIAVLVNPGNANHRLLVAEELPEIAQKLGVTFPVLEATTVEELDIAFASAAAQHADAINVFADALTVNNVTRVTALAAEHRLPAIYTFRIFAINGGLVSYGTDTTDLLRRAGDYVDKILKGTKPADLPVEQPTKFDLVINLKAAKALGLEIPASLLARADEVIE
jgi:putative ABC transport system substrate-binding protein